MDLAPEIVESYARAAEQIGEDCVTFLSGGVIYTIVLLPSGNQDKTLTRRQLHSLCELPQQFITPCLN